MKNKYRMISLVIIVIITCTFSLTVMAEEGDIMDFDKVFQVDMPCLNTLIKDQDGFIWMSTQNGLVRYDGYEVEVFKTGENSISNDYVSSIMEDRQGIIWVGSQGGGLDRYDKETNEFTHFRYDEDNPEGIGSDTISIGPQVIFQDSRGFIWVGTSDSGLNRYDPTSGIFTHYRADPGNENSLNNDFVWSINEDSQGYIWVGTVNGLNRLDPKTGTFKQYVNDPENARSIRSGWVLSIIFDNEDPEIIWLGINGGSLVRFDKESESFEQFSHPEGNGNDEILHLRQDGQDIWVSWFNESGGGGGFSIFNKTTKTYTDYRAEANNDSSVATSMVYATYKDDTGIVWIANYSGVVQKYDPNNQNFQMYKHSPSDETTIGSDALLGFYEDSEGTLWFGGITGGLVKYNKLSDTFTNYKSDLDDPTSVSNNFIPRIFEDSEGLFWISVRGGDLLLFDRETGKVTKTFSHNPMDPTTIGLNDSIRFIIEDRDDPSILWMGSNLGGFHRFDKKSQTFYNYLIDTSDEAALNNASVVHLLQDDEGYIWLSTNGGGMLQFDKKTDEFKRYIYDEQDENSIGSNFIWEVQQYEPDVLWIATVGGGLCSYNKKTNVYSHYNKSTGFPANGIMTIRQDVENKLWLGTDEGLVVFDPLTQESKKFTKKDGLQGDVFLDGAALASSDGDMWFGGINGLNRFTPSLMSENTTLPNVVIRTLTQEGEVIQTDKALSRIEEIELSWKKNFFEFSYVALNYTLTEKNQYAYMLEGFDKDWYYAGSKRFGRYSGLPPGNYVLRIKGSNNDGYWNEAGVALNILIKSPFYLSAAFIISMTVVIFLLIFGGFNLRIQQIKRRKEELEVLVQERTEELEIKSEEETAMNQELIALNEELIESNEKLTSMQKFLVQTEKMSALGSLVAGLAHEINTPIGIGVTASSNLTSLTKEFVEESRYGTMDEVTLKAYIEDIEESSVIIHKNLARAGKLVKNFKLVSTDQSTSQKRRVNINEYLEEIILSHGPMIKRTKVTVDVICEGDIEVTMDPGLFNQLISNLMVNSFLHGFEEKDDGVITIQVDIVEQHLQIKYSDNGSGMDEQTVSRIFEPFYTSKRATGGTGLGMYIVYNILTQQLDGQIQCDSRIKKGTTFNIEWPLV